MNGSEESDRPAVSKKRPNKAGRPVAEGVEKRGLVKGNSLQRDTHRIQGRVRVKQALERIRQAAEREKGGKLTSLMHHIYSVDTLREAYYRLEREASPGVDGITWRQYGEELESNLQGLSVRLARGAYRASPVRRVYVPKSDGRQRPIGVPALEDKIVQRATVAVLNQIYELDFVDFSYGFRPGRSPHDALDALDKAIWNQKVNWVVDADVRSFFDAMVHEWAVTFVEHRIGDKRVIRLIRKWLTAGVLEDGTWSEVDQGTPQGGSLSPLLANIYLHYAFDLWIQQWRRKRAHGDVVVVRFADDFIVGFQHRSDAEQFLAELKERFQKFGLELNPDKTRLLEFGRFATERRQSRGEDKPETFDFLGLTHISGKDRKGRFVVKRRTMRRRLQTKLREVKTELRRRLNVPVRKVGEWLASMLRGHYRYYGVVGNAEALSRFRYEVARLWHHTLERRSQKARVKWERMARLIKRWLPPARIYHSAQLLKQQRLALT
jgi:group II intron reverse transcriptase/maturase